MKLTRWNSEYYSHKGVDGFGSHLIFRLSAQLKSWVDSTEKDVEAYVGLIILRVKGNNLHILPTEQAARNWYQDVVLDAGFSIVSYEVQGSRIFDSQQLPAFFLPEWARGRVYVCGIVSNILQEKGGEEDDA